MIAKDKSLDASSKNKFQNDDHLKVTFLLIDSTGLRASVVKEVAGCARTSFLERSRNYKHPKPDRPHKIGISVSP